MNCILFRELMKENDDVGDDGSDDGGESLKMVEGVLGSSTPVVVRCFGPEKDGKTFVDIVCEVMGIYIRMPGARLFYP
jgi:hypothetical protein